jgi:hypothetical protein
VLYHISWHYRWIHIETSLQFKRIALLEHYDDAPCLSKSPNYVPRMIDRIQIRRLQRVKQLVQWYQENLLSNLEVIDECVLKFLFCNQTNLDKWCVLSLKSRWYKCNDYTPICKHVWSLKTILKEDFWHLQDFLLGTYKLQVNYKRCHSNWNSISWRRTLWWSWGYSTHYSKGEFASNCIGDKKNGGLDRWAILDCE